MNKHLVVILTLAGLFLPAQIMASEWITEEPHGHLNQVETEVHAVLGFGAVGAGFRVGIPIAEEGFIPPVNDSVSIDFGADLLHWPSPDYGVTGVVLPVMLQWNFYLTREWSVFGEAGAAFQNWFTRRPNGDGPPFYAAPGMAVGARYYLNPGRYPALVFRMGYPSGVSVGIGF